MTLPFWMIYDDREGLVPPVKATNVSMVEPERYVEAGLWHTADTLPELAAKIGVDADNLVSTVKRFNEFVATGIDEDFGRGDEAYDRAFSGGRSPMVPIETGSLSRRRVRPVRSGHEGRTRHRQPRARARHRRQPDRRALRRRQHDGRRQRYRLPGGGNPIGASMLFSHLAAKHMAQRPR